MRRVTSVIRLKDGADKAEYKRRHDEIWPEMSMLLTKRGMRNYSIWSYENLLFSYYETFDEGFKALEDEKDVELDRRWAAYMSDLIEFVLDESGNAIKLEQMFLHE